MHRAGALYHTEHLPSLFFLVVFDKMLLKKKIIIFCKPVLTGVQPQRRATNVDAAVCFVFFSGGSV